MGLQEANVKRIAAPSIVLVSIALSGLAACGNGASERAAEAERVRAEAEAADAKARAEAEAAREAQRLAALWTYQDVPAGQGRQLTAAINSTDNVATDGGDAKVVRLIFRDHASWGRSSYLVLQAGDFDCYRGCTLQVTVDDQAPRPMAGRRPRTDEAIAMFINDWRALWGLTDGATQISIEFPVTAGGTRTASFDVGGLDRSKMPGWDAAPAPIATAGGPS